MEVKEPEPRPQYLVDPEGRRAFVVLRVEEYEGLLEDLHDLAVMAERRDDQRISLKEFEAGLKADGLL